jgi:ankyrin repeat protein
MSDSKESTLSEKALDKLLDSISSGDVSSLEAALSHSHSHCHCHCDSDTQCHCPILSSEALDNACILHAIIDWNECHRQLDLLAERVAHSDPDNVATCMMRILLADSRISKAQFHALEEDELERGCTVLTRAVRLGNASMVKLVLADPHVDMALFEDEHKWGISALYFAARQGNASLMKLLLVDGRTTSSIMSRVDTQGHTVLMQACMMDHANCVELLLAHSSMDKKIIDHADSGRCTALHWAAKRGYATVTKALLADPRVDKTSMNLVDQEGRTALMRACMYGHPEVAQLLLAHPCMDKTLIDQQDVWGTLALHSATCMYGNAAVMKVLLADPRVDKTTLNHVDAEGFTALLQACMYGHAEVVELLLAHPCMDKALIDYGGRHRHETALHTAIIGANPAVVSILLADLRVDTSSLDHIDARGRTPLMWAFHLGRLQAASILLSSAKTSCDNILQALNFTTVPQDTGMNSGMMTVADMMATELTRRQMCAIYPPNSHQLWPKARAAVTVTVTVATASDNQAQVTADSEAGSDSEGPAPSVDAGHAKLNHHESDGHVDNALLDSFFSSQLFDVNVLGIIREYLRGGGGVILASM